MPLPPRLLPRAHLRSERVRVIKGGRRAGASFEPIHWQRVGGASAPQSNMAALTAHWSRERMCPARAGSSCRRCAAVESREGHREDGQQSCRSGSRTGQELEASAASNAGASAMAASPHEMPLPPRRPSDGRGQSRTHCKTLFGHAAVRDERGSGLLATTERRLRVGNGRPAACSGLLDSPPDVPPNFWATSSEAARPRLRASGLTCSPACGRAG